MGLLFGEAAGPEAVDEDAGAVGFGGRFVDALELDGHGRCFLFGLGAVAAVFHGGEFFGAGPGDG